MLCCHRWGRELQCGWKGRKGGAERGWGGGSALGKGMALLMILFLDVAVDAISLNIFTFFFFFPLHHWLDLSYLILAMYLGLCGEKQHNKAEQSS